MSAASKRASDALRHYLGLAGAPTTGENGVEIDAIVDDIIEAATNEALRIMRQRPSEVDV